MIHLVDVKISAIKAILLTFDSKRENHREKELTYLYHS